ncbi:PepSY-associated TM helix domain-containing protein [Mitsuaria sp. GD03876]|uniref:PepSY-associated TM helix domain-containing protein n=1 Tax=Mitsuaria sp. GD03876 TaxID=2975399 RepID=UPI00244BACC4|nr:PepSY-associated TM helix domain-containing protein [Mitsuaria sp. GD03876]MDH0862936.1 PepSY domain-containing protein [Mitsuaria sp. GD03876]
MRTDGAREGFRQAMAWLHTWTGLVLGWLLFAIFLAGTFAFFKQELNLWSRPELHALPPAGPLTAAQLARAEHAIQAAAPAAASWRFTAQDERRPQASVFYREAPAKPGERARFVQRWFDPATGGLVATRTTFGAGEYFYRFHFELRSAQQSKWILEGRWAVGLATLLMLVALLTGIVTHRRIFKDFFVFRPKAKAAQRSWLDAHNVCGVLALPFYLVITFSGLMTMHSQYLPAGIAAAYGAQTGAYFGELGGDEAPRGRARDGEVKAPLPLIGEAGWSALLRDVRQRMPEGRIEGIGLQREGARAVVEFLPHDGDRLQYRGPRLMYDATTLQLIRRSDNERRAATTYGVLYGLHVARFADLPLRFVLVGLGLLGTAMIATGLVLWSVKRRADAERRRVAIGAGHKLVDALNIGAIAGLPIAMAAFCHATRWLPLEMAQRTDAEIKVFYGVLALGFLAAALGARWRHLFTAGALAWAALPVMDIVGGWPFWHAGPVVQAVNAGFVAVAALLAVLAWRCKPGAPPLSLKKKAPAPAPASMSPGLADPAPAAAAGTEGA